MVRCGRKGEEHVCMQVHSMVRLAVAEGAEVIGGLKAALQAHDAARVAARVRRHSPLAPGQPGSGLPGRSTTVLPSSDITGMELTVLGVAAH